MHGIAKDLLHILVQGYCRSHAGIMMLPNGAVKMPPGMAHEPGGVVRHETITLASTAEIC